MARIARAIDHAHARHRAQRLEDLLEHLGTATFTEVGDTLDETHGCALLLRAVRGARSLARAIERDAPAAHDRAHGIAAELVGEVAVVGHVEHEHVGALSGLE